MRNNHYRRAVRQESGLAARLGGRRQPGSGNQWHSKADVKSKRFVVECKTTEKDQYILKKKDLDALRRIAIFERREWAFQIDLNGMPVVVMPLSALEELEQAFAEQQ